MKLCSIK